MNLCHQHTIDAQAILELTYEQYGVLRFDETHLFIIQNDSHAAGGIQYNWSTWLSVWVVGPVCVSSARENYAKEDTLVASLLGNATDLELYLNLRKVGADNTEGRLNSLQ